MNNKALYDKALSLKHLIKGNDTIEFHEQLCETEELNNLMKSLREEKVIDIDDGFIHPIHFEDGFLLLPLDYYGTITLGNTNIYL